MRKDKYIRVVLTDEERDDLLKSAKIIDELADVMGNVISADSYYDIDLEDLRDTIKAIAHECIFEISE
jgi:NTP pyrophosphatase (non-canonical NTP hydrolase)